MSERESRDIAKVGEWAVERLADRIGQAPLSCRLILMIYRARLSS